LEYHSPPCDVPDGGSCFIATGGFSSGSTFTPLCPCMEDSMVVLWCCHAKGDGQKRDQSSLGRILGVGCLRNSSASPSSLNVTFCMSGCLPRLLRSRNLGVPPKKDPPPRGVHFTGDSIAGTFKERAVDPASDSRLIPCSILLPSSSCHARRDDPTTLNILCFHCTHFQDDRRHMCEVRRTGTMLEQQERGFPSYRGAEGMNHTHGGWGAVRVKATT
jgi:hypothetical protein